MPNTATPADGDKGSDAGSFKFKSRSGFATLENQVEEVFLFNLYRKTSIC